MARHSSRAARRAANDNRNRTRTARSQAARLDSAALWESIIFLPPDTLQARTIAATLAANESSAVWRDAEGYLLAGVSMAWSRGWQPTEVVRLARLTTSSAASRGVVVATVAADNVRRPATSLDNRWRSQVDALRLPPTDGRDGWLLQALPAAPADAFDRVAAVIGALRSLHHAPILEMLIPPPGGTPGDVWPPRGFVITTDDAGGDPMLDKVRALLAKAESTTFEAEAMAFTAKAQELMTRHAIDAAAVGRSANGENPTAIRIPIDAPYVDAKSLLLQIVAEKSRCRAVVHGGLAMSTIVGFADDVRATETLFTSLLVQAQSALTAAARAAPPGSRPRSQGFRSAFLTGFAGRIGERLEEVNAAIVADASAELGTSFLPVLAARTERVESVFDERFSNLSQSRVRGGYDHAGYLGGRTAADGAHLASGEVGSRR